MREGWKCPVCGAGVSPDEKRCEHGNAIGALGQPITSLPGPPTWPSAKPWPWAGCPYPAAGMTAGVAGATFPGEPAVFWN